jgi:hypothetical protein
MSTAERFNSSKLVASNRPVEISGMSGAGAGGIVGVAS